MNNLNVYQVRMNHDDDTTTVSMDSNNIIVIPWCYDFSVSSPKIQFELDGIYLSHYGNTLLEINRGWKRIAKVTSDKIYLGRTKMSYNRITSNSLEEQTEIDTSTIELFNLEHIFFGSEKSPIIQSIVRRTDNGLIGHVAAKKGDLVIRAFQSLAVVAGNELERQEYIARLLNII